METESVETETLISMKKRYLPQTSPTKQTSPNRVICGPGMYGSMSSGVQEGIPWRTLLFRPDPLHFGAADQPNSEIHRITYGWTFFGCPLLSLMPFQCPPRLEVKSI